MQLSIDLNSNKNKIPVECTPINLLSTPPGSLESTQEEAGSEND